MKEQLQQICTEYAMTFLTDVPLSSHTTFHIGGNADFWIEINSIQGMRQLLQFCKKQKVPYFVMGRGSNILASDDGYRGVILHLGNDFSEMQTAGQNKILCQSGVMLSNAAKFAADQNLTGMEALSGIPGTIGGALCMNAGAYDSEMKDIVISCEYLDENGEEHVLNSEELHLGYRHSFFTDHPDCIVTSVMMQLHPGDPDQISEKIAEYASRRKEKQPLNFPSAGSTFKRPKGGYASQLIDECGLKGYQIGGAQVSEKHAGFVINQNHATCADVLQLCRDVRNIVLAKKGYLLELEPVLLGVQAGEFSCS